MGKTHTRSNDKRAMLQHFLGVLAYRTQKALQGAPDSFGEFQAGSDVRTPARLVRHMTGVLGYARTFFEGGIVGHIAFAHPFCPQLSSLLHKAAIAAGVTAHMGGTCIVMEGPAFSTVAESNMYRSWGANIIGMTALPEAKLAREAEMCYATLACVTDYDVWHSTEEQVTVELVVANLMKNVAASQEALRHLLPAIPSARSCDCVSALHDAVITARDAIPLEAKEKLQPIIGKYIS